MSDHFAEFDVDGVRFEFHVLSVIALGVVGDSNAPEGPRVLVQVRRSGGETWRTVSPESGSGFNFENKEVALLEAKRYVAANFDALTRP